MQRVLLIVIDGWTARLFEPALHRGELPCFADLVAAGSLDLDCVSIFPSITPAATASIVTGEYPDAHGIAGMSWWKPERGEIVYFGDDVMTILQRGIGDFVRSFLLDLNHQRLAAPTLFQIVERHGRRAACFNHLIFRGDVPHELHIPQPLSLLPSLDSSLRVQGPSWLCLGDFVSSTRRQHDVETSGGMFHRFGMDDQGTADFLSDLPDAGALPDFAVAYFADYDFDSHDRGPDAALETLRRLDARLRRIFDSWGGLERVLREAAIVVTADHSHSIVDGEDAAIVMDDLLDGYRLADPAHGWSDGDELLLCPNMRAAEVHLRREHRDTMHDVCTALLEDSRVDQVIWSEVHDDRTAFRVATREHGSLQFAAGDRDTGQAVTDEYGNRWATAGELSAIDASVDRGGRLQYGVYPNALERIAAGVHHPRTSRAWVTARPGYEFRMPGQQVHQRAGSHGTLHELDSRVPLLVAGGPPLAHRPTPRIVDVAPLCARLVGVPMEIAVGAPRYSP